MKKRYLIDDEGYSWIFDGHRVYMEAAELEMKGTGNADQNGYPCSTYEEARAVLVWGGYLEAIENCENKLR